ncbi:hypothetical protein F4561_002450 [Lipingzhangella halophila]|uniref:Uncharacterized protein n=1 Tax=Lipingzhangella halophila TaxID=1783352 RepID=A0A7W7RGP2_9ACTN|nr:hypothetical protein [Lipingzhangella halophila]MBB4931630.1 hypothetical protein [Lipingzhangella halophila]
MDREDALDGLVAAEEINRRVRRGGRWYAGWAAVFAGMSVVLTLGVGFLGATWVFVPFMVGWAVSFAVLLVYALSKPVTPAGFGWMHGLGMGVWGVVFAAVLTIGQVYFPAQPAWWVPGALVTAVPLLAVACVVLARSREAV